MFHVCMYICTVVWIGLKEKKNLIHYIHFIIDIVPEKKRRKILIEIIFLYWAHRAIKRRVEA